MMKNRATCLLQTKMLDIENHPWNVPVPVKPGGFVSVGRDLDEYNVSVNFSGFDSFGVRRDPLAADTLLFADLQTNMYYNCTGRLGSGRSGFYKGKYLKGVGRTSLAANWNSKDHLHNSGHLAASSAIREYVISIYLKALGFGESIVPCVGVLLAHLRPELKGYGRLLYGAAVNEYVPPVDSCLQAITVKDADFFRASNFIWLLHHLTPGSVDGGRLSLAAFSRLLGTALSMPGDSATRDVGGLHPEMLVKFLRDSIWRACSNFQKWYRAGVWWGSFTNNVTIDGRFLDLELPAVSGGTLLGFLKSIGHKRTFESGIIGIELLDYLAHMRAFCKELSRVLLHLPKVFSPLEREFAWALSDEIDTVLLGKDSILVSREKNLEHMCGLIISGAPSLSKDGQAMLEAILEREYDRSFAPAEPLSKRATLDRRLQSEEVFDMPRIITEPGYAWKFHSICLNTGEKIEPTSEEKARARLVSDLVWELDCTTDLDLLASKLNDVPRRIFEIVGKAEGSLGAGSEDIAKDVTTPGADNYENSQFLLAEG